jgi:hypothetical protein
MFGHVILDDGQHRRRDDDDTPTRRGLGRGEERGPTVDLGELPRDAHRCGRGVDIAATERDELAPAQAAEAREQDQGVVAGTAGLGERVDLGDGQQRPLG